MKKIKRVYVAGPYSADNVLDVLKNIGRGQKMCSVLFKMGFHPFCPWHDKSYVIDRFYDDFTVDQFYEYSISWLEVSDCVLLVGEWRESKGTLKEIEIAYKIGMPVFQHINELLKYNKDK